MATPEAPAKPEKRRRQDREFRILFRPTECVSRRVDFEPAIPGPPQRRKLSRVLGLTLPSSTLVDDLCSKLVERSGHWALAVLKVPNPPCAPAPETPRIPVIGDDSRIERVFEISRLPRNEALKREEVMGDVDVEKGLLEEWVEYGGSSSQRKKGKGKEKEKGDGTTRGTKGKAKCTGGNVQERRYTRAPTPDDSSEDDRHEDDEFVPVANETGKGLKMQVSEKPRNDFAELQFKHLGGPLWEILTGIEARTKFTNTELKHEATRIWKRQQNYHTLSNNCQRFCILMAITIRAKNHSLLRVLHGETVKEQIKGMKFEKAKK